MKTVKRILCLLTLAAVSVFPVRAQEPEVVQLVLNIEKLSQLKQILDELKKGYEILFTGYSTIRNLAEGNFKLHQAFLDGLLKVSPAVKNYKRVYDIIDCQLALVSEYRVAMNRFAGGGAFTQDELAYIQGVYSRLIAGSLQNLDALTVVVTDRKLRASDDERLLAIDAIYEQMTEKLQFLRLFNGNTSLLAAQRNNEKADQRIRIELYGITP